MKIPKRNFIYYLVFSILFLMFGIATLEVSCKYLEVLTDIDIVCLSYNILLSIFLGSYCLRRSVHYYNLSKKEIEKDDKEKLV